MGKAIPPLRILCFGWTRMKKKGGNTYQNHRSLCLLSFRLFLNNNFRRRNRLHSAAPCCLSREFISHFAFIIIVMLKGRSLSDNRMEGRREEKRGKMKTMRMREILTVLITHLPEEM